MIFTVVGVPSNAETKSRTAFSVLVVPPELAIDPESSTMIVIGPPQRLRASAKLGPVTFAASMSPSVVPPAVMLTRLTPPPVSSSTPPPSIVTTIRRAVLPVSRFSSVSSVAAAASGTVTSMTSSDTGVTPGSKSSGPSSERNTMFLLHVPASQ